MRTALQTVVALVFILTFQVASAADALACSCAHATRQELRDMLPLSFDGRVVATRILNKGKFGALQATVQVVRKIKGDVASEVSVFSNIEGPACGVADQLAFARANGRILEFGVEPNTSARHFPAGELVVSLCSLSSSELEPTPPNAGDEPVLLR